MDLSENMGETVRKPAAFPGVTYVALLCRERTVFLGSHPSPLSVLSPQAASSLEPRGPARSPRRRPTSTPWRSRFQGATAWNAAEVSPTWMPWGRTAAPTQTPRWAGGACPGGLHAATSRDGRRHSLSHCQSPPALDGVPLLRTCADQSWHTARGGGLGLLTGRAACALRLL